jgi:ribose transport system permease protein
LIVTQTAKPAQTEGAAAVAAEQPSWLARLDWRRYVIYIGFVVIFIFFAILLGDQGFL